MDYVSIESPRLRADLDRGVQGVNNLHRLRIAVGPIAISRSACSGRRSKRAIDRDVVSAARLRTGILASALRYRKVSASAQRNDYGKWPTTELTPLQRAQTICPKASAQRSGSSF